MDCNVIFDGALAIVPKFDHFTVIVKFKERQREREKKREITNHQGHAVGCPIIFISIRHIIPSSGD